MSENTTKHIHFKKSAARLYAIQALFQMEVSKSSLDEIVDEFELYRIGASIDESTYNQADLTMFRAIINNAVKQQSRIDKLTDQSLDDSWPLKRIDPTLRALFRAATSELLIEKTPPKAVINEFIEIAKAFFPNGKEPKLVNGVLDNIMSLIIKGCDK
jgi:N utilization substance protein B